MIARGANEGDGPVVQSISIGFRVLYVAIAALFCFWAASNWQAVPADSQAVVLRFGRIVGVQPAGLTVSWPRPVGAVALLPGPERLLTVHTLSTAHLAGLEDPFTQASGVRVPEGAGSYLTGDGGVVLLAATVAYRVSDGAAYYLARDGVEPALRRLFEASAVTLAAERDLDDFLVARPDRVKVGVKGGAGDGAVLEARRQAMRGDLQREMNRRLGELAARGGALGVEVGRVDLEATLPPAAKIAFDQVLVAVQLSEQGIAGARTEATRTAQAADRERDQVLTAANANAAERVDEARSRVSAVSAIEGGLTAQNRPAVLDQLYRDQLAGVLHKVGKLTAVDARAGARVILPAVPGGAP